MTLSKLVTWAAAICVALLLDAYLCAAFFTPGGILLAIASGFLMDKALDAEPPSLPAPPRQGFWSRFWYGVQD
jgi:hypothetical protein